MSDIPTSLRYTEDHLWARHEADSSVVRVGITDFAQQSLGDVVAVTPPKVAAAVRAGEACGDIESVKSVSDLIAPVTGTVRASNDSLANLPEIINTDPYGQGWLFELEADQATVSEQLGRLLDADAYRNLTGS
jgi:glycine cleavage system H protein